MSHGFEVGEAGLELAEPEQPPAGHPLVARLDRAMKTVNRWVMVPCMLAVVLAAAILTYSVAARYFFKIPTEWQDETAIFLLMGATFFSGGVRAVATAATSASRPSPDCCRPRANHWRMLFVEVVSLAFCAFFAGRRGRSSRGPARRPRKQLDLGSADVDPVLADGRRHDAADDAAARSK